MKDPRYFANETGREFECYRCGFGFTFAKTATFEHIQQRLEAHTCYPTALKITPRPLASAILHSLLILASVCCLGQRTAAQEKPADVPGPVVSVTGQTAGLRGITPKRRLRFDLGDVAYWGGSFADIGTSVGQREANPLLRDSQGRFSLGKGLAFKGGVYGAIKTIEYFYPDHPKTMLWFKVAVGVGFGVIAIHNAGVK